MDTTFGYILAVLIAAIGGFGFGWDSAHSTVATECNRLGAFYVAKTTYECKAKP